MESGDGLAMSAMSGASGVSGATGGSNVVSTANGKSLKKKKSVGFDNPLYFNAKVTNVPSIVTR